MTYLPGLAQTALPTTVVWDPDMTAYNFGHGHPMAPERMELTARLAGSLGLLDLDHVSVAAPEVASDEELRTVHSSASLATSGAETVTWARSSRPRLPASLAVSSIRSGAIGWPWPKL